MIQNAFRVKMKGYYISWSRPFQTVNPKVKVSYMNPAFGLPPEKRKLTSGSPNLLRVQKAAVVLHSILPLKPAVNLCQNSADSHAFFTNGFSFL